MHTDQVVVVLHQFLPGVVVGPGVDGEPADYPHGPVELINHRGNLPLRESLADEFDGKDGIDFPGPLYSADLHTRRF